ncbi:hypothetical protein NX059_002548 [Plenodomus lindquistii]|nr:hypothetical protein NX059_002548 [Plenodomus lindquistii]
MSLDDYEQMLDIAEKYCSRDVAYVSVCYAVDSAAIDPTASQTQTQTQSQTPSQSWTIDDSRRGLRRHLQTDTTDFSESRAKTLRAWIAAGRARIRRCRNMGTRLNPPIQHVGYVPNSKDRMIGNEGRNSANWLSLLAIDICQTQWPDKYSLKYFVICLLFDEPMAPFSETILTRFLRAYIVDGGLSIDWAGESIASLELPDMTAEEERDFWNDKQDYIRQNTDYDANVKKEHRCRMAYYKRNMDAKKARLRESIARRDMKFSEFIQNRDDVEALISTVKATGKPIKSEYEEAIKLSRDMAKR